MVNETSENTSAAKEYLTSKKAKVWLDTLDDCITNSKDLKPWLLDTERGILIQTSMRQNVGSAVIFYWPESWSEESKAEISAYLRQVSSWVRQKMDNMVSKEEIRQQKWGESLREPEIREPEEI